MEQILFAEFKEGGIYAVPYEDVTQIEATEIAERAKCQILRMPKEMLTTMLILTTKKAAIKTPAKKKTK